MITALAFKHATGLDPTDDDLERINCKETGKVGHKHCGWCYAHDKPRFHCGCLSSRGLVDSASHTQGEP